MVVSPGSLLPALALAATVGIILYEYHRTGDFVTPLHLAWGFFGFFFLLSYVYTGAYGADSQLHPFATPDATATEALAHLLLAFVALTIGYYSPAPRFLGGVTVRQLPDRDLTPTAARLIGLALFIVGLLAAAAFVAKNGGLAEMLAARNIFVFRTATGSLRYWLLLQLGLFAGLALYLSGARFSSSHLPAYSLGVVTIVVFFAMHTRMRVIFGVLLLGLYAWYADSRVTLRRLVALGVVCFLALGLFRPIEMLLQGHPPERAFAYIYGYLTVEPGGMFVYPDYFQGYMALLEGVPTLVSLQYGRTLVAVPWLPFELFEQMRAVATDPTELTEIAVYGYDRPDTGIIPSGFGVLYVNFHLPGVLIGAAVYGVMYRWAYVVWRQTGDRVMVGALYFVTMYYFFLMMAKTPIMYNVFIVLVALRGLWFVADIVPHAPFRAAWRDSQSNHVVNTVAGVRESLRAEWKASKTRRYLARIGCAWEGSVTKTAVTRGQDD